MAPDSKQEEAVYERFLAGDRDAFGAIYDSQRGFLFRYAVSMTGSRDAAEDITHEVFVWLIHNRNRFDAGRGRLGDFLAGVMRKLLMRHLRNNRRWQSIDDPSVDDTIRVQSANNSQTAVSRLDAARLREAVANLPARYREAVTLCDLEGLSYEASARVANCSVGTLRSRLHRGRKMLVERFTNLRNARGAHEM